MLFRSLRFRLLVMFSLVLLVAIGTAALYVRETTATHFVSYVQFRSQEDQAVISKLLTLYSQNKDPAAVQSLVEQLARATGRRIIFVNGDNRVIADSERNAIGTTIPAQSQDLPDALFLYSPVMTIHASPATKPAPPLPNTLVISSKPANALPVPIPQPSDLPAVAGQPVRVSLGSGSAEGSFITAINRSLLLAGVLAGLAAVLLTVVLSARILKPVKALTVAATRMQGGDLSQRVHVKNTDEIGTLARAFNAMADSLARSEQLRRNLISDVAHDLRTPLTNIRGYLEALEDRVLMPTPATIASIREEAMLLNRLIDDLQELALADAGQLRLSCQPVAIEDVLHQTANAVQPRALAKRLTIRVDVPEALPPALADPGRVSQILRNVIGNAITHTPDDGQVVVSARATLPSGEVEISVCDTGAGITPEHLPYIFERFYRADPSRARATGGTGLGLAIVKQLVEAQGGHVSAKSELGHGTTITFTLPMSPASVAAGPLSRQSVA